MFSILIVDNDKLLTHMMKEHLEQWADATEDIDLCVKVASSPAAARAQVSDFDQPIDLLLVDYRLDGTLNGIELITELARSAPDADKMLFTGYSPADLIAQLRAAGIDDFLAKPFRTEELSWRIGRLMRLRQADRERDWLQRLSSISQQMNSANTVEELAQSVTQGVARLGFSRARFYRIQRQGSDEPIVAGVAQAGLDEPSFAQITLRLRETEFVREVVETGEVRFFERHQPRPRLLKIQALLPNFKRPTGDWIGVPAFHLGYCEAVLFMDADQHMRVVSEVEKRHVHLLAEQLSAAYSRVAEQEAHQLQQHAEEIARRLGASLPRVDQTESLEPFCSAFQAEVLARVPDANLDIVIYDRAGWVCEWMRFEQGALSGEYIWRSAGANTMIPFLVTKYRQALWLPTGTAEFRLEHDIHLEESGRPAKVWMGVPFRNGDEVVGAILLEHDDRSDAFDYDDFALLCELASLLGNRLYATWLNLQRKRLAERLAFVQRAAEDIMLLAEQNEGWLWHAVLTAATAHFGFGFDRALLLLRDGEKPLLAGQKAIGHERWVDAEADWRRVDEDRQIMETQWKAGELDDDSLPMAFWHRYLDDLRRERDVELETPLNAKLFGGEENTARLIVPLEGESTVLHRVLSSHKTRVVEAADRRRLLPQPLYDFLYAGNRDDDYEETDCAIVPVTAGDESIGLLLLDNVWAKNPPQVDDLRYIDTLTNQAAVLFKNRIQDATRIELDDFKHQTLNRISDQPQGETLSHICDKAKAMLAADHVAIYPIEADEDAAFHYGTLHLAGVSDGIQLTKNRWSTALYSLDSRVLRQQQVRALNSTHGLTLHPYVAESKIRAMMIVPVVGSVTGHVRAVMYVDYLRERRFTLQEMQFAREFSALAATVLRQYRQIDAKSRREHELEKAGKILSQLLQRSARQRLRSLEDIVSLVLSETADLLNQENVSLMLALREWQRAGNARVYEVRKEFVPNGDGVRIDRVETDIGKGIRGLVLEQGRTIYAEDLTNLPADLRSIYQPTRLDARAKIYVPIPSQEGERPLGILVAESPYTHAFTSVQVDTMQRIATAAGMVIRQLRPQVWMTNILDAVSQISLPTDLDETLNKIGQVIHRSMPEVDIVTIWQRKAESDPETLVCGLATGPAAGLEEGRELLASRRPIILDALNGPAAGVYVEDTTVLDHRPDSFARRYDVHAYAAQRIMIDGDVFGLLFLSYCHPHAFLPDERTLLPVLASIIAAAINDARRLDSIRMQKERFAGALEIARAVGASTDVDEIIANILEMISDSDFFPDATPAILLYEEQENLLEFTPSSLAHYAITNPAYEGLTFLELEGRSLVATTAKRALEKGTLHAHYAEDVHDYPDDYLSLRKQTRSQLTVALFNEKKQKLIGVFLLESIRPHAFDADAQAMAELVATDVRVAVERGKEMEEAAKSKMITTAYAGGSRIAHEVRQEINLIANSCFILGQTAPQEEQKYLAGIKESIKRLNSYATYAGEYAERGEINLRAKLYDWLFNGIQPREANDSGASIQGRVDCSPDIKLETRPKRLAEVLEHLIRNSCEALNGSEPPREIRLTAKLVSKGTMVEIICLDNGPGVPESMERRLFQTRKSGQTRDGRGNGLLFAENIVTHDLMGTLHYVPRVRDGRARGAKFVLRLPLALPADGL